MKRTRPGGQRSWAAPDASGPETPVEGGLEVDVLEQRPDGWAHVRFTNGWQAWLNGNELVEVPGAAPSPPPAAAPSPSPPTPAATPAPPRAPTPVPAAAPTPVPSDAPQESGSGRRVKTGIAAVVVLGAAAIAGSQLLGSDEQPSATPGGGSASQPAQPSLGGDEGEADQAIGAGLDTFAEEFAAAQATGGPPDTSELGAVDRAASQALHGAMTGLGYAIGPNDLVVAPIRGASGSLAALRVPEGADLESSGEGSDLLTDLVRSIESSASSVVQVAIIASDVEEGVRQEFTLTFSVAAFQAAEAASNSGGEFDPTGLLKIEIREDGRILTEEELRAREEST